MPDELANQPDPNTPGGNPDPNPSGDQPSEWLPPELKTEKTLEKFKDVSGLAKSYIELEKDASRLRNAKGVIVPGEKATPDEIAAFHKALGRPDTPDGYGLEKPELPEGMTYDEDRTKAFAEVFHKHGANKELVKAVHGVWNDMAKADFENQTKAVKDFTEKTTAEMKKEWGKDFDTNLAAADAAIDRVFGPDFKAMLKQTGLANHPAVIKGMFKASQAIGEHALARGGEGPRGQGTYTMEKLISMKMDPRYSEPGRKDPAYIKDVEAYNQGLAAQMGANS
ncbi:MAG: hypothetical protein IMZ61_15485 [Planctomycetes bacterium]|nr:hypothetical protein [Candidatus Atribacteria bacterium]MBE3145300.1 hypothetical protein [Planctomycetota bacterium]